MSYGKRVGATTDMERCGLFAEMSYLHGKGYNPPIRDIKIRDLKGPQMNPGVPKVKTGLQDCYFDTKFKRIFEGEGWIASYHQTEAEKENITTMPFLPVSNPKTQTSGGYDAIIGQPISAFSPIVRDEEKQEKLPPNVLVQPAKKGGPGYTDICLSPYPKHKGGLYDDPFVGAKDPKRHHDRILGFVSGGVPGYFNKNPYVVTNIQPTYNEIREKQETRAGPFYPGAHARKKGDRYYGGLSPYPNYESSTAPNKSVEKIDENKKIYPFYPQPRDKTFYTNSVMVKKIEIATNNKNWRTIQPITYTKEFY
ncbi:cilia-and flagella-associated protein 96-like [Lycorma delicatula]|uniref:cilia-and flagella-associated protein 96-like n=1 Tax=Lycorma delicatula TaxID=130591 RepID=UPI003F512ACA